MEFNVELTKEHLERIGQTQPLTGLIELVWNALDADANEIKVEFARNAIEGIEEIRVRDDGHGMLAAKAREHFGALGLSEKATVRRSPGGRALHGQEGRGRYRAAGIGSRILWRTVAADPGQGNQHFTTTIELKVTNLAHVSITDPEPTDAPTGTTVVIPDLGARPPAGLHGDGPVERLTGTFALQLQNYNAHLSYDGSEIDPAAAQANRLDVPLEAEPEGAMLTIVEWKKHIERGLYLCDSFGTPLTVVPPGIQAPSFEFTAYLQWTGFEGVNEADLHMLGMGGGPGAQLIETVKESLRTHFKRRLEERTREQIDTWKAERTYPFEGNAKDRTEQAVRDVFDVVALTASSAVTTPDVRSRRLSLRLLREALEQDPGSLHKVLREVLDLPTDRLEELSGLLEKTSLASIIALSKEVANRLDFLRGLEALVLDPDLSKQVKERTQLHKILASETWVFGEEYALSVNDEGLTTVLKRHIELLGRPVLAEDSLPVKDADGYVRIVDLMLSRSLGQARNRREHLVVELKRPSVKVGDDEAAQIRKYATAVATDSRFSSVEVQWDFIVVSSDVTGSPELERRSNNREFGLLSNMPGIRVWVFTWGEIIDAALHRLKFAKEHLDYEPNNDQAFEYLRATHDKYLPPQDEPDGSASPGDE